MRLKRFRKPARIGMAIFLLVFSAFMVGYIFWHQELKYNLPTPKPADYTHIPVGSSITLSGSLQANNGKPTLIHFYNPACPCSKFNLEHVNALMREYKRQFNFGVVVCHKGNLTIDELQAKFEPGVELSFDTTVMAKCGVYSTPQAVVLDADNKLFFRGNYNKSRYCTTAETNYAQLAMQSLLQHTKYIQFDKQASVAYGCQTEYCAIK